MLANYIACLIVWLILSAFPVFLFACLAHGQSFSGMIIVWIVVSAWGAWIKADTIRRNMNGQDGRD